MYVCSPIEALSEGLQQQQRPWQWHHRSQPRWHHVPALCGSIQHSEPLLRPEAGWTSPNSIPTAIPGCRAACKMHPSAQQWDTHSCANSWGAEETTGMPSFAGMLAYRSCHLCTNMVNVEAAPCGFLKWLAARDDEGSVSTIDGACQLPKAFRLGDPEPNLCTAGHSEAVSCRFPGSMRASG
jgi:hypothetical protein